MQGTRKDLTKILNTLDYTQNKEQHNFKLHHGFETSKLPCSTKEMVVAAFVKGMTTSPFSDSLIRHMMKKLVEVHERAMTHIEV